MISRGISRWQLSDTQRFLQFVKEENGCWLWQSTKKKNGYGTFSYESKKQSAHRVSYRIFKGEIPIGMQVHHKCDNPSCVNPLHLWIGFQTHNIRDAIAKGRHFTPFRKLNKE